MAKTTAEKIEHQKAEIQQAENQLKRLLHQQKDEERKARTHRICQRGGLLEKLLPDTIPLTETQIMVFFEKTLLTQFARRALSDVIAQGGETQVAAQGSANQQGSGNPVKPPQCGGAASAAKAPETAQATG